MSKNSIIDNQVEHKKQRENILPLPIDSTKPKLIKFYPLQYGVEILMTATTIAK